MAWIAVDDSLRDHPKLRQLCHELGVDRHTAIGYLVCLWCWGLANASEDGVIRNANADDVCDGMMLRNADSAKVVGALVNAGLLDFEGGTYTIHDFDVWQQYWFKAQYKKEQNARYQQKFREKQRTEGTVGDNELPPE